MFSGCSSGHPAVIRRPLTPTIRRDMSRRDFKCVRNRRTRHANKFKPFSRNKNVKYCQINRDSVRLTARDAISERKKRRKRQTDRQKERQKYRTTSSNRRLHNV